MTARSARKVTAVARIIAVVFFAVGCHATALFTSMLGVVVTPESPTMAPGASLAFTASVNGTPAGQSAVTWSLQEAGGGTVDSTGLYTAPATEGVYHLAATSANDSSKSGTATVTVTALTVLTADRRTVWNPGLNSVGGIPNRTTVCATVQASTYGNGAQDATAGIQAAVDACPLGQVVQFSAGTFTINNSIIYLSKGITLRGAGPTLTTLSRTNGADMDPNSSHSNPAYVQAPIIIIGPTRWPIDGTSTNLTADAVKGAYSVTVASASGLAVGDIVHIDELVDPNLIYYNPNDLPGGYSWFMRYQRPISEWKEISAINGTTVSFNTPLHTSYRTAFTAQLTPMAAGSKHVKSAGVENLKMRGGSEGNVRLVAAAYSWVKNVDCTYWGGECVDIASSFRCELRDSFIHDGEWPYPGGGGYAISIQEGTSDTLVENNISMGTISPANQGPNLVGVNKVIVFRAAGAGCVVGYNYVDNGIVGYDLSWQEVGINGSHMCGSHHTLFEGNYAFNADGDNTHGNQVFHTFSRNYLTGKRSLYDSTFTHRGFGLMAGNWWMSAVANVIGYSGMPGAAVYESTAPPWPDSIWKLGYDPGNWNATGDPKVISTVIRHGNFDYLTNKVAWDPSIPNHTLPPSLYLTGKPAFFNAGRGYTWPWVEPTSATPVLTLPAKARYDAGTPFVQP